MQHGQKLVKVIEKYREKYQKAKVEKKLYAKQSLILQKAVEDIKTVANSKQKTIQKLSKQIKVIPKDTLIICSVDLRFRSLCNKLFI